MEKQLENLLNECIRILGGGDVVEIRRMEKQVKEFSINQRGKGLFLEDSLIDKVNTIIGKNIFH